ncbi:MAG: ABC transporter permease subunit [Puniceicoccaceae bacterium]|nr:MAG: ABC transporter permease subunit [Puniceicoccaceae bacterium]
MGRPLLSRGGVRFSVWFAGMAALLAVIFYLSAWLVRPDLPEFIPEPDPARVAEAERLRDVRLNLDNPPVLALDVAYPLTPADPAYPRGESPILRGLVEEGRLPPVHERVGPEPLVMAGVEGIGNYGGSWYRVASSIGDVGVISWRLSAATLVRWSPEGYPIVPNLAKSWDVNDDYTEFTFHLRRGIRWSDGHLVTADDILFWWEKEVQHFDQFVHWMTVRGEWGTLEKVDDFTIRFTFPHPYGIFIERLATIHGLFMPAHYLLQYHPEYGDQELIRRTMRAQNLASPLAVYNRLKGNFNPEHPRLWPWVYRTHQGNPPYSFVRNPYYWAVDTEGNQLPYVDRVLFDIKAESMIGITAASGEITMQLRHLRYEDHTLLMDQRERNNYQVYHWFQGTRSVYTLFPNLNRWIDPGQPETANKHALLNDRRFRQALSLAINRGEIIRSEFNDQTVPAQIDPGPESAFHHPPLFHSFTDFDPERANRLLDDIGLTQRDREGFRTFADGSRMTFYIHTTDYTGSGAVQMILTDWARVGVRAILREQARTLWQAQQTALRHDFSVWSAESDFYPLLQPRNFVPTSGHSFYAPGFAWWYNVGGLYGDPRAERTPGAIEPPLGHPLRRSLELYEQAISEPELEDQVAIFREIFDIAAEEVWSISISTPPPQLVVVQNGFRNVPRVALTGAQYNTPANAGIETYFFDQPSDSPGAIAQIRRAMIEVTPEPAMAALDETRPGRGAFRGILRFLIYGSIALGIILAGLRHPYIGRRLLIMVPTLLIISVITFVIIQLPPGDFITARIQELQMSGDDAAVQAIEDLKELFYLDDPPVVRYLRWLGVYWFFTFAPADQGLLQGNLGRSMEDTRLVNDVVGDRILLTVLISFLTIVFTWAFAIPAGIYSAVRQYSTFDYILTLIGFIGMSVPNFLLALLLIYWSDIWFGIQVTGLFSAEFAAQPEWDWPKFVDLMKHIWVPVVVLGTAGTAGMIRVMRGNLLDELGKPYVVTARAKGVRPMKLLMKYPVRLALNPFISGIGGIFPQLVSGGAIVAMVLSLPTVGPLMLSALMTQDMYLAGSMLMVLSMLGVFGTLVSDLLLLWLDPRIRMEGGVR